MSKANYRRKTPQVTSTVLFKFTEQEHAKINGPFRHSLQMFKDGTATQTDWFNCTFRIKCAYLISLEKHEDITKLQLKQLVDICEGLEERARAHDHVVWEATPEEIEWLEAGFDAIEELQRTINRKFFYDTCVKADYELREKYVAGSHWKQKIKKPT